MHGAAKILDKAMSAPIVLLAVYSVTGEAFANSSMCGGSYQQYKWMVSGRVRRPIDPAYCRRNCAASYMPTRQARDVGRSYALAREEEAHVTKQGRAP